MGVEKIVDTVSREVAVPPAVNETGLTLNDVVGQGVLTEQVTPEGGVNIVESVMEPMKPLRLMSEMVELPLLPAATVMLLLAVILKSAATVTVTVTVAVRDTPPLVPVTVTV